MRQENLTPLENYQEALKEIAFLESQTGGVFDKSTFSRARVSEVVDAANATRDLLGARQELARLSQGGEIEDIDYQRGLDQLDKIFDVKRKTEELDIRRLFNERELADIAGDQRAAQSLNAQIEKRQRINELMDLGISKAQAEIQAADEVNRKFGLIAEKQRETLENRNLAESADIARLKGADNLARRLEYEIELRERIQELRSLGLSEDAAGAQARIEVDAAQQAQLQGQFREAFQGLSGLRSRGTSRTSYAQSWPALAKPLLTMF